MDPNTAHQLIVDTAEYIAERAADIPVGQRVDALDRLERVEAMIPLSNNVSDLDDDEDEGDDEL